MPGDLHSHTLFSDGSCPASAVPAMAAAIGLSTLAISDHDSIQSVRYAYQNPIVDGVELIPATELTAYDPVQKHRVHLLVYYPDDCAALQAHCDLLAARRNESHLKSAAEIEQLYPQFKTEDALAYAKESGVLYKCAIMKTLHELGIASGIYTEVYRSLFAPPPEGRVLHDIKYPVLEAVLQTIQKSRGVVVLAHPSVYRSMPLLRKLVAKGRIDGIEVYHPRNTEEDKVECLALARQHNLIVTGGTDFHGSHRRVPLPIGTCTTADEEIAKIKALAKLRKG